MSRLQAIIIIAVFILVNIIIYLTFDYIENKNKKSIDEFCQEYCGCQVVPGGEWEDEP